MTAVGAATGVVVGLVAVTPAAGFIGPMDAILLGIIAAFPSYFAILWRSRSRLDDSLDVVAAHGIGGLVGALLAGVFARAEYGGTAGLLEGNFAQLGIQVVAVLAALVYSAALSLALFKLIRMFTEIRVSKRDEATGLDVPLHGEEAYSSGEGAILILPSEVSRNEPETVPGSATTLDHGLRSPA